MVPDRPSILFGWKPEWQKQCEASCQRAGFSSAMQPLDGARLEGFDAVVPLTLADQVNLEARRAREGDVRALPMPGALRQMCHDKLEFAGRMSQAGFVDHIPGILDLGSLVPRDFPVVVKSRRSEHGRGTFIVQSPADLEAHLPALIDGEAFLQELIPGSEEFAVHILLDGGMMLFSSAIHYSMAASNLVKGKPEKPKRRMWLRSTPFKPLWHGVLSKLGIHSGTVCIDFRLREGKPVIFEINPRVGSSLTGNMEAYLQVYVSCFGVPPRLAIG
jgi:biotin carboxylase